MEQHDLQFCVCVRPWCIEVDEMETSGRVVRRGCQKSCLHFVTVLGDLDG
jgi:hypothetical protein